MRVYLGVLARGGHRPPDPAAVARAVRRSLPFRTDGQPAASWTSSEGSVQLHAWHNEPEQPERPLLTPTASGGAIGWSGYVLGEPGDLGSAGVWAHLSADEAGLTAATCSSGAEVLYLAQTPSAVIVGNRALLVHLVSDPTGPHPDLVGLAGVLNLGYPATDRTAFTGVRALGVASLARADRGGIRVEPLPGPPSEQIRTTDIAERLLASVAPLAQLDDPVRLGLTGGRDSRLILGLLARAGVPVQTLTRGDATDPDVIVATQVAAALGVPHSVRTSAPAKDGALEVDPVGRLHAAVVLGEGMLTAYDRVGKVDDRYRPDLVPFSGTGGEILRAYFATSVTDVADPVEAVRHLRDRVVAQARPMTEDLRAAYEDDLEPWWAQTRQQAGDALEDFYVRQRIGRWQGAARSSASTGSLAWRPFLDHHVVAAVRAVPVATRTSERLVADLIDELAPELREIRFAGSRWAFERTAPTDPQERAAWESRAPVTGRHGSDAGLNWRTDLPEVRSVLREVVLDAPEALWDLVDRARVEASLARGGRPSRADVVRTWHLATIAHALASDFGAGTDRWGEVGHTIRVKPAPAEKRPSVVRHSPREVMVAGARRLRQLIRSARRRLLR